MTWPLIGVPAGEQRTVRFKPAFHRCHTNPSKDYGISGVTMLWVLRVDDWAITWDVFTDWGLPDEAFKAACPDCTHPSHRNGYPLGGASGGTVEWHAPVPLYEDHDPRSDRCPLIDRDRCYGDVGYTLGSEVFDVLRTEGDEATWRKLRDLLDDRRSDAAKIAPTVGSEAPAPYDPAADGGVGAPSLGATTEPEQ